MEYRYFLEKGSKKFLCPSCQNKSFVRYIDGITSNYLPKQFGRCDRESKCGYHLNPYTNRYNKEYLGNDFKLPYNKPKSQQTFIPDAVLKSTLVPENYNQNSFIQNLLKKVPYPLPIKDLEAVISHYYLGTVPIGPKLGAITFPFININNKVCAIQVKKFDEKNHTTSTDFLHAIIERVTRKNLPEWLKKYKENEIKVSCLFGEHLLKLFPNNPVALVEAPKTAIYATLYFGLPRNPHDLIWLAVYNKSSFKFNRIKVLKYRKVLIFPDLSPNGHTYEMWQKRAKEFESQLPETNFIISDLLEKRASEKDKNEGNDLADILIKLDWRPFRKNPFYETNQQPLFTPWNIQNGDQFKKFNSTNESLFKNAKAPFKQENQPTLSESSNTNKTKQYEICEKCDGSNKPFISNDPPPSSKIITLPETPVEDWSGIIEDLENFFNLEAIPKSIEINSCHKISDLPQFINTHLSVVKTNNGKRAFLPYLDRLKIIKKKN